MDLFFRNKRQWEFSKGEDQLCLEHQGRLVARGRHGISHIFHICGREACVSVPAEILLLREALSGLGAACPVPSASSENVTPSLMTGDQWLVLPAGGGPGPDQTPEGGQAETAAPERCVHTTFSSAQMLCWPGAPLLPSCIVASVTAFCGISHLTPGRLQTLGPGTSHRHLLEHSLVSMTYLVRLSLERVVA